MKHYQQIRYEKMGYSLFQDPFKFSPERTQVILALRDERDRLESGDIQLQGWQREDALHSINRLLKGFCDGSYALVIPNQKEKDQIARDGISIHTSLIDLVAYCLRGEAAICGAAGGSWIELADALMSHSVCIVKTV
jgi:hypothetical protein